MSDISSGCEDNRVALGAVFIIVDEFGEIVNLIEKGDPNVIVGIVDGDVLGRVEIANLEGLRITHCLLNRQLLGFLGTGRRHSCSHWLLNVFIKFNF